jgi:PAS domain S-box-containing protein
MSDGDAASAGFGYALDLIGPMLTADSLEEAAAHATRLFAALSGAEAVAIFLVSGKDTGGEFWVPADEATRLRFRPHLRGLALEFLAQGVPVTTPFPPEVALGLEPVVLPLLDRGRTLGVVCLAGRAGTSAGCASAAVVVARQMAQHQDAAQSLASRARYERWFRQFDAQMRLLERERQKFAAITSQTDTYVFTASPTRNVRWANRAMTAHLSEEGDAAWTGRTCDEVWARLGQPAVAAGDSPCPVARVFSTSRPVHQEFRLDQGDRARAFYVTALPIRDPDGRVQEVLVVVQDLSGLALVRRVEHDLGTVVSSAPVVLFAVDRDGIFRLSEGRGLASLGLEPGQVVGTSAFELYRDVPQIGESLRRALAGEDFSAEVQVGDLAFETRYSPQRDEAGQVIGVVGVATDISERRRLEVRLRDAQQMDALGRLAAGVAEDFGELLTVVMGNVELMLGRLQKDHPLRHPAEEVQRASARGAQLVHRLRLLCPREAVAPQVLDPDALLTGLEGALRRIVGDGVELVVTPAFRPALVRAESIGLEQALLNLVARARGALPQGGRIVLQRGEAVLDGDSQAQHEPPPGTYVTFTVSRSRPADDRSALSRGEPSAASREAGGDTTFGFTLARGIARRWGGDVVEADENGAGVVTTLYLPHFDGAAAQGVDEQQREAA